MGGRDLAKVLDALAARYGKPPHYWLGVDEVLAAFDYEVLTRALAE